MSASESEILAHYGRNGLLERIVDALRTAFDGALPSTVEALAPVDQFHTRGLAATAELADFAELPAGAHVLDIGSGLGGPARYLASARGHRVTALELVPEFCRVAAELTRMTGLSERVRIEQASALELPFEDDTFDAVWTIQAQMNIEDKKRFYSEACRVLTPGGRFVFQDIFAGNGEPLDFPVPWASRAEQSFLVPADRVRSLLAEVGLREVKWRDVSAATIAARRKRAASAAAPGLLGTHLVMGDDYPAKRANSDRNLDAGRIVFIQGVFDKRG